MVPGKSVEPPASTICVKSTLRRSKSAFMMLRTRHSCTPVGHADTGHGRVRSRGRQMAYLSGRGMWRVAGLVCEWALRRLTSFFTAEQLGPEQHLGRSEPLGPHLHGLSSRREA